MAGESATPLASVQVSMIQTLYARAIWSGRMELPGADLIVVDECHHAAAYSWRSILDANECRKAVVIGLTVACCRSDGKGLGDIYDLMLEARRPRN
jgi:DNA repair protein RadD